MVSSSKYRSIPVYVLSANKDLAGSYVIRRDPVQVERVTCVVSGSMNSTKFSRFCTEKISMLVLR
jgi:hypothetical protein